MEETECCHPKLSIKNLKTCEFYVNNLYTYFYYSHVTHLHLALDVLTLYIWLHYSHTNNVSKITVIITTPTVPPLFCKCLFFTTYFANYLSCYLKEEISKTTGTNILQLTFTPAHFEVSLEYKTLI